MKTWLPVLALSSLIAVPVSAGELRIDGFPDFNSHFDKVIPSYREDHPDTTITYQMNQLSDEPTW